MVERLGSQRSGRFPVVGSTCIQGRPVEGIQLGSRVRAWVSDRVVCLEPCSNHRMGPGSVESVWEPMAAVLVPGISVVLGFGPKVSGSDGVAYRSSGPIRGSFRGPDSDPHY